MGVLSLGLVSLLWLVMAVDVFVVAAVVDTAGWTGSWGATEDEIPLGGLGCMADASLDWRSSFCFCRRRRRL